MILVDSSALMALVHADDQQHERAAAVFEEFIIEGEPVSHNYVVLESSALLHRRVGDVARRRLLEDLVPQIDIAWIDRRLHARAVRAWLAAHTSGSSLVDHVSFEVMRDRGIERAFAFDADFARAGFTVLP